MLSTSVVHSCWIPATPLLNDPLPVLYHLLGQPDYSAHCAAWKKNMSLQRVTEPPSSCVVFNGLNTNLSQSLFGYEHASGDTA